MKFQFKQFWNDWKTRLQQTFGQPGIRRLGAKVKVSDDFMTKNLEPDPTFKPDLWWTWKMDGWLESRRRRERGWLVVNLEQEGLFMVWTRHPSSRVTTHHKHRWKGWLQYCYKLVSNWEELLPISELKDRHLFSKNRRPLTHVRLNTHPDGGIARLRVCGTPSGLVGIDLSQILEVADWIRRENQQDITIPIMECPGWSWLQEGKTWEMLGKPGRREPGNDWILVRLGATAEIEKIEVGGSSKELPGPVALRPQWQVMKPMKNWCRRHGRNSYLRKNFRWINNIFPKTCGGIWGRSTVSAWIFSGRRNQPPQDFGPSSKNRCNNSPFRLPFRPLLILVMWWGRVQRRCSRQRGHHGPTWFGKWCWRGGGRPVVNILGNTLFHWPSEWWKNILSDPFSCHLILIIWWRWLKQNQPWCRKMCWSSPALIGGWISNQVWHRKLLVLAEQQDFWRSIEQGRSESTFEQVGFSGGWSGWKQSSRQLERPRQFKPFFPAHFTSKIGTSSDPVRIFTSENKENLAGWWRIQDTTSASAGAWCFWNSCWMDRYWFILHWKLFNKMLEVGMEARIWIWWILQYSMVPSKMGPLG